VGTSCEGHRSDHRRRVQEDGGPDLGPTRARNQWRELGVDGIGIADEAPGPDFPRDGIPKLTTRMVARLQGFDDAWVFSGKKTAAYRQVGNAFPPPVACALGTAIAEALSSVSAPKEAGSEPRIAMPRIVELDNVEKTFIGLKVEHFFRDKLDIPKGVRDLRIVDEDVDIKHTVGTTWTIPPETYRIEGPCVLIMTAEDRGFCRLGLIRARDEYLTLKTNRDGKRSVSATGKEHILWLLPNAPFPVSRWEASTWRPSGRSEKSKVVPNARRASSKAT
jgi:hypothetical protein